MITTKDSSSKSGGHGQASATQVVSVPHAENVNTDHTDALDGWGRKSP